MQDNTSQKSTSQIFGRKEAAHIISQVSNEKNKKIKLTNELLAYYYHSFKGLLLHVCQQLFLQELTIGTHFQTTVLCLEYCFIRSIHPFANCTEKE